ncbi:MAG: DUF2252 family protein [Myxococcales bacterium]|nr:DUF2252 family protein [Myxococcales bacterium]
MKAFVRDPARDKASSRRRYCRRGRGLHLYFRHVGPEMQRRFCELVDVSRLPRVFLHGNPHVDNYAKTERGAAMVDFDRARYGPYAYDIVRFLVSAGISAREQSRCLMPPTARSSLRRGYAQGVLCPQLRYEEMHALRRRRAKRWQQSTVQYVEANRLWARKMRENAMPLEQLPLEQLLASYARSREEPSLLEHYRVSEAAQIPGSMGKMHTVLLLESLDSSIDEHARALLLDFKEVYDEPDTRWFHNPFAHNGERMVRAGELHAPGWEMRPGWATVGNTELWVRQISPQQVKVKRALEEAEQMDLCFAVGSQLGAAHAASATCAAGEPIDREALAEHFLANYEEYFYVAAQLEAELRRAYEMYTDRALRMRA